MVPPDSLTRLISLRQSVISLVNLLSPFLAGLAYALVPLWVFLAANGLSFLLSALSDTAIDFRLCNRESGAGKGESFRESLVLGARYFRGDRLITALAFCGMGLNFFLSSLGVILPFGLVNDLKIPEKTYGIILSAASGGALLGALIAGKANCRLTRKHLLISLATLGFLLMMTGAAFQQGRYLSTVPAALIIVPFPVLITAAAMMLNIPLGVFFQSYVEKEYLGRVGSLTGAICETVMPISYLVYGFLTGFLPPLIILGGSGLLVLILVLLMTAMPVFGKLDAFSRTGTLKGEREELA